jgi:hypothetical protein
MPVHIRLIYLGLKSSGSAIMAIALYHSAKIHFNSYFKILIILVTALAYYFFRTSNTI